MGMRRRDIQRLSQRCGTAAGDVHHALPHPDITGTVIEVLVHSLVDGSIELDGEALTGFDVVDRGHRRRCGKARPDYVPGDIDLFVAFTQVHSRVVAQVDVALIVRMVAKGDGIPHAHSMDIVIAILDADDGAAAIGINMTPVAYIFVDGDAHASAKASINIDPVCTHDVDNIMRARCGETDCVVTTIVVVSPYLDGQRVLRQRVGVTKSQVTKDIRCINELQRCARNATQIEVVRRVSDDNLRDGISRVLQRGDGRIRLVVEHDQVVTTHLDDINGDVKPGVRVTPAYRN